MMSLQVCFGLFLFALLFLYPLTTCPHCMAFAYEATLYVDTCIPFMYVFAIDCFRSRNCGGGRLLHPIRQRGPSASRQSGFEHDL